MIFAGGPGWPHRHFARVALVSIAIGVAYTIYSEWLNVAVRGSWAYAEAMPRLPWVGTGLAPLAQWFVVPAFAFGWLVRLRSRDRVAGVADS